MNTNIDIIQKEIDQLFGKYEIPAITKNLPMQNLHEWASKVAKHFRLDQIIFQQVVTELFWSMAHVQLSLGHTLLALQECDFPNGTQGVALHEDDVPTAINMPEIYFWYHTYNSYECIYRCWERINNVIKHVCLVGIDEKKFKTKYLPQTIEILKKDSKYTQNPCFEELEKQLPHRKEVADIRNEISHGKSSPFRNMNIDEKASNLLGANGLPFIYLEYSYTSLEDERKQVVDKYRKVLLGIKAMKNFIDNIK